MSLQDERRNEPQKMRDRSMPVICLRCDAPMRIKTITPAMQSALQDEIVYGCPACKIERKQTVPRADQGLAFCQAHCGG
jgi:hypothetical protein